ncbi:MAG: alpha/beta hydrolase-fold protein, partial [Candidatus Promineifilaceae bacterium]|nr:alpha/beta hydrolase-fold protein [Candidatus Promineifilaceae bacterium]
MKAESPRLNRLRQSLESSGEAALTSFWEELAEQGTPLIEADPHDDDVALVSFLWRGRAATANVQVRISLDGSGEDEHEMSRLPGTRLWYATFRLPSDYMGTYKFLVSTEADVDGPAEYPDPLNPKRFIEPRDPDRPDHAEDDIDSALFLPAAPLRGWVVRQPDLDQGQLHRRSFTSSILGNERRIWIYTPPGYHSSDEPCGLLMVLDGRFFTFAIDTPALLDNLLADSEIRPLAAVLVDNPGDTWKQAMATREHELSCHPPLADFLADELLPWIRNSYRVSNDPQQTVVAGGSAGGLAAAFVAWERPESFGNVIALPSPFWWRPVGEVEWEWLARQVARGPLQPVRFFLEVGLLESAPAPSGFPGQLLS